MMSLLLFSSITGAVNSLCMAGSPFENSHGTHKKTVNECNDELNDYYKNCKHKLYKDGLTGAETVMYFQKYSPQHFITHVHGAAGNSLQVGRGGWDNEDLTAQTWRNNLHNGGMGVRNIRHASAPFSSVVLLACGSGTRPAGLDYTELFWRDMECWVFVGCEPGVRTASNKIFGYKYSDQITDRKAFYRRAISRAVTAVHDKTTDDNYHVFVKSQSGGPLHHDTIRDTYRCIKTTRSNEGQFLFKESSNKWLYYDNTKYSHNSNGAYVILHGNIDNNEQDQDSGELIFRIWLKRWNGMWNLWRVYTYDIANRRLTLNPRPQAFGGIDTCTAMIPRGQLDSSKYVAVEFDFNSASPTCNCIKIDRCEIMEIGN